MKILGLSAFYHDSAAALVVNGEIVAAAQEERFTRQKHCADFPTHAVIYCLEEGGYTIDELDAVVFYDKPLLKFERLLETYYACAPKGLRSFLKSIPVWLGEKMFLKKRIKDELSSIQKIDKKNLKLLFTEHHLAHAASAFYASPYEEAAILTIDGVGEWCTASISVGSNESIKSIKELHFPHSVGLLYSSFTYYLGFRVNSGEYKLMGLAPYGIVEDPQTNKFIEVIKSTLVKIDEDGSIWLDQNFFTYATGLRMVPEKRWETLFGFPRREEESALEQKHCNLALAAQKVIEEIVLKMAHEAKRLTGLDHLCMAGGVALNCVANGVLVREQIFTEIYVQPAAGDAGGALGAALAAHHIYFGQKRQLGTNSDDLDTMKGAFLGPYFSDKEVQGMNRKNKAVATRHHDIDELVKLTAEQIASGKIIGWFQGRMEFGPRALGNRSILADPRDQEMQKRINLKVKYRETFRPFAPSVLEEDQQEYFDLEQKSPYMLLVAPVHKRRRKKQDPTASSDMWTRLYSQRSDIQAVTHLDFSARVQSVSEKMNSRYYKLIEQFKRLTGYGLLINTSFNVRGEPIVCSPEDAYHCFMNTEIDVLVINDYIYLKADQPKWDKKQTINLD